jgi:nucleotide-binding universal stress UspA family protein
MEAARRLTVRRRRPNIMSIPKTFVVPTDFSDLSKSALRYASELAQVLDASLHIVHVVDEVAARFLDLPDYAELGTLQTTLERSARDQVAELVTAEHRLGRDAVGEVLTSRSTAESIVGYARDVHADLIVLGTHGRNAIGRLLLGTVAERVVRTAHCPVLTIRSPAYAEGTVARQAAVSASRPTVYK